MTCKRMCSARNLQLVNQTSAFAKKSFVFGQGCCWCQRLYGCCVPKVCGGVRQAGLSIWIQCPPARSLFFNLAAKTTSILRLPAGDCRHPWRRPLLGHGRCTTLGCGRRSGPEPATLGTVLRGDAPGIRICKGWWRRRLGAWAGVSYRSRSNSSLRASD